jgi:hypothetical protein
MEREERGLKGWREGGREGGKEGGRGKAKGGEGVPARPRRAHLLEVLVRVEALGHGVLELAEEGLAVAAVEDVVGDVLGLVDVLDDEVRVGEGRGGDGLLVRPLAVDHRRHLLARVRVHRVPHLAHPRARRVHDLDPLGVQELRRRRRERGVSGRGRARRDGGVGVDAAIHVMSDALKALLWYGCMPLVFEFSIQIKVLSSRTTRNQVQYLIRDLHFRQACSESREDDHVAFLHVGEILCAVFEANEIDVHLAQAVVHAGVVNDFVSDVYFVVLVKLTSLISQSDSSVNTPAKAV